MSKKLRGVIIGAAAVVVLIAMLLILMNLPSGGGDDTSSVVSSSKSIVINEQVAADVKTVKVTLEDEEYTMTTGTDPAYSMTGMEDAPASAAIYAGLASDAAALKALDIIREDAADAAEFGLDKPRSEVEITYADGSEVKLAVGNDAPSNAGVYVLLDGKIYLFDSSRVKTFLYHRVDYISKTITPTADTGDDAPVLKKITLEGAVRPEPLVLDVSQETSGESSNAITTNVYTMSAPNKRETDSANTAAIGNKIFGLSASKVISYQITDELLEEYGLKDPYSKITADYADQTITLIASKPDKDGLSYVMNLSPSSKNNQVIFQMDTSEIYWVTYTYQDVVNKAVMAPLIYDLSKVTVSTPDKAYEFGITTTVDPDNEGVKNNTITYEGKELVTATFRKFYQNMLWAKRQEYTDHQPTGEPLLTFKYEYTDGRTPDVVEFYKGENMMVYTTVNGECDSLENSSYVDKIISDVEKVINNEEVKTFG